MKYLWHAQVYFWGQKQSTTTSNPTAEQHLGGAMTPRQCNPLRAMHRGASYDIHRRFSAHWCSVAVHLWHAQVHLLELTIEGPLNVIFFPRYLYDFFSLPIPCAECYEGAFPFHVWLYFISQAYLNWMSCIKVLSLLLLGMFAQMLSSSGVDKIIRFSPWAEVELVLCYKSRLKVYK